MSTDLASLLTEQNLSLIFQMGGIGITGGLIGYAVKKVLKIAVKIVAVVAGLFFAAEMYLASTGVITINYDKFAELARQGIVYGQEAAIVLSKVIATYSNAVPGSAAFLTGLAVGFNEG